jgi:DNA-binding transcriptional MerR regulator
MDERLAIGRFARLSGLSVGALRHYDELGLLPPAAVDPLTGYRRYDRRQVSAARTIGRLRDLDVPLETIRAILTTVDASERSRLLHEERGRVEARITRLQRVLHVIGQLSTEREALVSDATTTTSELDAAAHRRIGAELFNHVWTLLETLDRTPEQTDDMIHAAHASRYHWTQGGEPSHVARGEWQCARVYSVLGRAEPALWHARRCVALCEAAGLGDWDVAAAYEGMARASAVAGDAVAAAEWKERATMALAEIGDPEDRELIEGDIATIP